MNSLIALGVVAGAALLLLVLTWAVRRRARTLRVFPALTRLYRAVGLSVEDGTRLLVGLGNASLLSRSGGSAFAGLALLREISQKTSVSDRPPVAVSSEALLALLSQDTLQSGYQSAGAPEYFQPAAGRLTGLTPFSAAAATIPIIKDEHVSAGVLIGHYGVEAALMADAAERANVMMVGSSDDPSALAALYAAASETMIGEELFSASAYVADNPAHSASLAVQDILRWIVIAALLIGSTLKFMGII